MNEMKMNSDPCLENQVKYRIEYCYSDSYVLLSKILSVETDR